MKGVWLVVIGVVVPVGVLAQEELSCIGARGTLQRATSELKHIDEQIQSLQEQIARLKKELAEAEGARAKRAQEKTLAESAVNRACQLCTQLERRGENLMKSFQPLADRVEETARRVKPTLDGIVDIATRLRRASDDYRINECAGLVPGKSDRVTLAKCDSLENSFRQYQERLKDYRALLTRLQKGFSELVQKTEGPRKEMQRLIMDIDKACGDSERSKILRIFAGQFEEFQKNKVLLDAAEKNLNIAASIELVEGRGGKKPPRR